MEFLLQDVKHQARRPHGVGIEAVHGGRSVGAGGYGRTVFVRLRAAQQRVELAARLGSPWVVATPPREECDLAQISRRYRDLLELGREAGVRPTMEYISFFGSVSRLDQARRIVEEAEDPDATVIIDSFHTWNSGGDIEELRELPAERISHFHIDDADPDMPAGTQTDPNRVMPGDGPIDLAGEIAILREIGYEGTVSLELFNPGLWEQDPAEVLRTGIERMRELLA